MNLLPRVSDAEACNPDVPRLLVINEGGIDSPIDPRFSMAKLSKNWRTMQPTQPIYQDPSQSERNKIKNTIHLAVEERRPIRLKAALETKLKVESVHPSGTILN